MKKLLLLLLIIWSLWPALTKAELPPCTVVEPQALRGWLFKAAMGPAVWTGPVGESSALGIGLTLGTGYEFLSWLAVEATWTSGLHDTRQPSPPAPGSFATHAFHFGGRLAWPMYPFDFFVRGGAGWTWSIPNILIRIEEFDGQAQLSWLGGAGIIWHTPRRRVWLGLECNAIGAINSALGTWIVSTAVLGVTL